MQELSRRSVLLSTVILAIMFSLASAGQDRRGEDAPWAQHSVETASSLPQPWSAHSSAQIGGAEVGGTRFDTIGFSSNANGDYYTVFNRPQSLPVVADSPSPNDIFAGEFLDGRSYMIDFADTLYEVDASSGQILNTVSATVPPNGEFYSGMAIDPTTGTMYASSTNFSTSSLLTIDVATGAASVVGTVTNAQFLSAVGIDGAGELWGLDPVTDSLLSINKTTAAGTIVGPLGFDAENLSFHGMAWDPIHDVLWIVAFNGPASRSELRAVDRTSGFSDFSGELGEDSPGGVNGLGWLGLATPEYFQLFSDGFESGDTNAWSNTVP